jgi:uncharacterized membrane protein
MTFFEAALMAASILCSLVAGFLFAFAVVVMPGIRHLEDRDFIRAFQMIDRVIQDNQPLFLFVWLGSVVVVCAAAVLGFWELNSVDRLLMIVAALVYLLGVQLPTAIVNVPLNNRLQKLDPAAMSEATRARAREEFEARWNRWNTFRTACASLVSMLLVLLLVRV